MVGESRVTNSFLRMLDDEIKNQIDVYVADVCSRNFTVINSTEEINNIFEKSLNIFLDVLTYEELLSLRSYTGYNFKNINAVLRNNWTYDNNGILDSRKNREYRELAIEIENIINKFVIPNINFIVFRGTTIDSFSSYNINELSQLKNLKDRFLYEQGFTSTSLMEESSYINKKLDDGRLCNVGIRYLIPSECEDGALLISNDTSYSMNQNEFLLTSGSLSKVIDVNIDENAKSAILTVVFIPKKIYDVNIIKEGNKCK